MYSAAQYIDPYQCIIYCQNITRIHGTSLTAISSTALPVPLFTTLTNSVKFFGDFIRLNLLKTGRKMQKQNRQCTYNVTLRRVRVTIVDVKNQYHILSVCVTSLRHPACKAHAPYYHLWSAWFYNIFSTLSHRRHDFQGKKMCLVFLYNFCLKHFSFQNNRPSYCHKSFHVKRPLLLSDFNQTWHFSIDFRKIFKYKISWKSFHWKPNFSIRTDGQAYGRAWRI